ncbi:smr domain-containing protein [Teratosphaeria destructans]|uniref:Smr domain-containing protein n=1 Tax=Teratosphaeria destructans TaxID=418781 RepID=A0A9W7SW74_9PEZI|nr:smr domain-containing protein [Teratosphaeria destructans]
MDDNLARLERDYCPPLDPALLSAIVSDYDLGDDVALRSVREILDQLKESALAEEAAGFDPSGIGASDEDAGTSARRAESCPESRTQTDLTSISNGLSSLDISEDESLPVGDAEDLERLDEETKVELLQDVFPDRFSKYMIQHTLRKCNGKWQSCMEELLNHVYFEEAELSDEGGRIAVKGIDAFADERGDRRGRKGKAKNRRVKAVDGRRSSSLPLAPADSPAPVTNKWQAAAKDVEFIADRTRIATSTVSSEYNKHGSSVPKTIGALLKATMEESKHVVTDDAAVAASAWTLGHDFPTISPEYLAAIVRLTYPSTTAAQELATALTTKPRLAGGVQIVPQYARPLLADADAAPTRRRAAKNSVDAGDLESANLANAYASARATAFSQAQAAHRKAKSDRLMGGAAAYYGQVGREYNALSHAASAAAADKLANAQSTSSQVDLHGIDVQNAVRIAKEKVEDWWDGLGESRFNGRLGVEERQTGYRIIVGLGTHSVGGKGKLGPAVTKALAADGWKFENAGAVILVNGRLRR